MQVGLMKHRWSFIGRGLVCLAFLIGVLGLFSNIYQTPLCTEAESPSTIDKWDHIGNTLVPRSEGSAVVWGDYIFVVGGMTASGATTSMERFDIDERVWRPVADLPVPLHHFGMTTVAGKIYITGGYVGNQLAQPSDETWVYDPEANYWRALNRMPYGRAAHGMVAVDQKLYVVGGVGVGSTYAWSYEPLTDEWYVEPIPSTIAREHLTAVSYQGKIVVIGGRDPDERNLANVEIFDPVQQRWYEGAEMPTARSGLSAAIVGEYIHVVGGEDLSAASPCTYAEHEVYDPVADVWTRGAPLLTARHGANALSVDNRLYVIGGAKRAGVETKFSLTALVEVYEVNSHGSKEKE